MIELNAACTALLRTILYNTAAKATAATVPTAYSAVVMPASMAPRTAFARWAIRFKRLMPPAKRLVDRPTAAASDLWTTHGPVDDRFDRKGTGPAARRNAKGITLPGGHIQVSYDGAMIRAAAIGRVNA